MTDTANPKAHPDGFTQGKTADTFIFAIFHANQLLPTLRNQSPGQGLWVRT